ncbi:MAG TPA: hypothetical protein VFV75_06185 [Candidatus Polarisedimenticolaceae bacterium]|nr:hypothetical protein [Candidatus Polarisedimenticolaceae bacterium]
MKRLLWALLLLPSLAAADEVFLRGAGSISGRIVEQTADAVTVDVGAGQISVPMANVERIAKGKTALDEFDARAARLKPEDVEGWKGLGNWAASQGLSSQARQAYEKVLAVAPDDLEARDALGYVRVEGKWLTEEEGYRAKGYVRYDGEWMTPAEVQMAKADEAAEQAARDRERKENEAAAAAAQKDYEAQRAAERERQEDDDWIENTGQYPVYWGGSYGYGLTYWPSTPVVPSRPARPAHLPARPVSPRR